MSDEVVASPVPQVIALPGGHEKYVPLLAKGQSVKMKSGCVTLEAGQEIGSHNTVAHEEMILVLEGEGEVEAEGMDRRKIHAGCAAYMPPHTQHNVINTSASPLRYVFIVTAV